MTDVAGELLAIAAKAEPLAERANELDPKSTGALESAAHAVGKSWSKSSLGYQANVYYNSFMTPPSGHMFSREWGFLGQFSGSIGEWKAYDVQDVVSHVKDLAENPDLTTSYAASNAIREEVDELIQ